MGIGEAEEEGPIFRDIRRYYCEYCGICRSKKTLIASHVLTHHKEEMEMAKEADGEREREKSNTCQECGATFKKPAYLKQHMQSHSLEDSTFLRTILPLDSVKHWIPHRELQNASGF